MTSPQSKREMYLPLQLPGAWLERAGLPINTCDLSEHPELNWKGSLNLWKWKMVCISWPFLMQQACCLCVFNIRKRDLEPTIHFSEKLLLYSYTYSSIRTAQVLCEQNLACSSFILVRRDDWRESSQILRAQTEFVRLKIRRKGKLSIPDVQLLRNWALLFIYTNPL